MPSSPVPELLQLDDGADEALDHTEILGGAGRQGGRDLGVAVERAAVVGVVCREGGGVVR